MFLSFAMRPLARSIPRRILAALLSIYLATYFATAVVVYSGVRAAILESDSAALNHLADLKYEQLSDQISSLATDLTAWSELDVMNDLASGDIDKRVTQTLEASKHLYGLAGDVHAFDAKGALLASSSERAPLMSQMPEAWRKPEPGLLLLDKHRDPISGKEIIALEIPVVGSFDKHYRIGTLVMTYPWSAIEKLLFNTANQTVLWQNWGQNRAEAAAILASSPPDLAARIGLRRIRDDDRSGGSLVVGRSAPRSGLLANWQVVMLHDTASATGSLRWVALRLALLGASLGIPIVLLGRWLSYRLTSPIAALTRAVRVIADTDRFDARVPVTSSDELGSLAQSFNRMAANLEKTAGERELFLHELTALNQTLEAKIAARTAELEAAVAAQRRLLGDISHEIKSPLARLSMAVGLAGRTTEADRPRQFARMEREIDNIAALAGELLILARLDAASSLPKFASVDLAAVLTQVAADAVYEMPGRRGDVIVCGTSRPAPISGNADLLRRAVENIVRNALFYTNAGTPVEISLRREPPRRIVVDVRDRGPGVPECALQHLFEPFYRVDQARARATGGTGIGLTICRRVVELHGGSVRARNNRPTGLVVELTFPGVVAGCGAGAELLAPRLASDAG